MNEGSPRPLLCAVLGARTTRKPAEISQLKNPITRAAPPTAGGLGLRVCSTKRAPYYWHGAMRVCNWSLCLIHRNHCNHVHLWHWPMNHATRGRGRECRVLLCPCCFSSVGACEPGSSSVIGAPSPTVTSCEVVLSSTSVVMWNLGYSKSEGAMYITFSWMSGSGSESATETAEAPRHRRTRRRRPTSSRRPNRRPTRRGRTACFRPT